MRTLVLAFAAALASSPLAALAEPRPPAPARSTEDLARARVLDQQGAKAYADGRYNDAIRYFEEAHRLGGPPFELWNIAKCHVRLDQTEQAAEMLERYLATPTLPAEDREEAAQQLESLRRRPSTLTLSSVPAGASVAVDGRPVEGKTPTSVTLSPGSHSIALRHSSHATYTQQVEAKYGRAIILEVPLGKDSKDARQSPPQNPYGDGEVRRIALRGDLGIMLPRYGSLGGRPQPSLGLSGAYRFADAGPTTFSAGAMMLVTGDAWDNTVGAPTTAMPCGVLRDANSATALSFYAMAMAGWEIAPRLRLHAVAGLGVAAYLVDDVGGDVFIPQCKASPSAKPAFMTGGRIDYALTPLVRLSALPILLQLQPSFEGTRSAPIDTSGVWIRATIAIGAGVDL